MHSELGSGDTGVQSYHPCPRELKITNQIILQQPNKFCKTGMNTGLREKGILPRENFIERWPLSWALNEHREFHS